jgi:hypothetical protein
MICLFTLPRGPAVEPDLPIDADDDGVELMIRVAPKVSDAAAIDREPTIIAIEAARRRMERRAS